MQCPHCHYELPQGALLKFCPYCARQLQANYLNKRTLPKWKETCRVCGGITALISGLLLLCFFMPFVDLGMLGTLSGYDLIIETFKGWGINDSWKAGLFSTFLAFLVVDILGGFITGIIALSSNKKYGNGKSDYLQFGIYSIIWTVIIYIWVYNEVDGVSAAIGFGPYCIIVLALCKLGVGIYGLSAYNRLDIPQAPYAPQPQQASGAPSSQTGINSYDVILIDWPEQNVKLKDWMELFYMFGDENKELLYEARNNPPARVVEAVSEADAQMVCAKFREIGATVEIRPHS